ncbi:MAG TPA: fused MFS/spermidine synthase [Vicinamibacterales bacterium]|nr:fused MFS/spermidine synthase [Vicinamibacterales bacterium]
MPGPVVIVMRILVPLFAVTLFFSSFLMFTVEPMVARQMLPVLGGVPMVWNGCVVFFQAALLAGYGGAHALTRGIAAPVRLLAYAALAVLPLAFVRLGLDKASAAHATEAPLSWLLVALLTSVGPLFLMLAVSAPVLQSTFASTRIDSARDPYFLYAASNAGSLVALAAYPTLIEPLVGLNRQTRVWTIGYAVFVGLVLACALAARSALRGAAEEAPRAAAEPEETGAITWRRRARWCLLAAVPSSLMLGVTTALTTDIAPVPLLWVAPLALYLLTFVVAFGTTGPRATGLAERSLPALLLTLSAAMLLGARPPFLGALLLHLVPFLAAAMLCHGLLAADRPGRRHLTEFYVWLALGGMAGGLVNTLLAPLVFSRVLEYPLALTAVAFLRPSIGPRRPRIGWLDVVLLIASAAIAGTLVFGAWPTTPTALSLAVVICAARAWTRQRQIATLAAVAGVFLLASPWANQATDPPIHAERTFYGTYRVGLPSEGGYRTLKMGTTVHGMQSIDAARQGEPLTYYHRTGPFGRMFATVPQVRQPGEIAVIGLGIGTLSAYAQPGQRWTFFEIDPAVERIARDVRYFTFLETCGDRCRVVLGDARLSLSSQADTRYQLIALDAFSSDAIPLHLLTREAVALYLSRLAPHGMLAFHVSNRHLNLAPIVWRLAADANLTVLMREDRPLPGQPWAGDKAQSTWVMAARSPADFGGLPGEPGWALPLVTSAPPLWTDDFSNIFSVLNLVGLF